MKVSGVPHACYCCGTDIVGTHYDGHDGDYYAQTAEQSV